MPAQPIHWYQASREAVTSWEFQVDTSGSGVWEGVQNPRPFVSSRCTDCFDAVLEIPVETVQVRARAIGPDGVSEWSTPFPVPEAGSGLMGMAALLVLALLSSLKSRSSRLETEAQ